MFGSAVPALPEHAAALVAALNDPRDCAALDGRGWERMIRVARSAQMLGTLAARIEDAGMRAACPLPVQRHLAAAAVEARHIRQMARIEMQRVSDALAPLQMPLVLLKGASYLAQDLPVARGRQLRDVDALLPRNRLEDAEHALHEAGWEFDDDIDDYDQHYYRAWSHQLPPLRRPGFTLELDLHHTILPPTGRVRPDAVALLRDSRAVSSGQWRVLDPADQVIHACVHLFQDSDCTSRLRDVYDIDALCRHFAATEPGFWRRLTERALQHGATHALWYALAFAQAWIGTPLPDDVAAQLARFAPMRFSRRWVLTRAALSLPPPEPDLGRTAAGRRAARWMLLRSVWLRMPPHLLAYHAAMKSWRALSRREPAAATAPR
jgi:hypothetical protein